MDYNSVSKYGNTAPGEDFAEATIVYFRTEGGTVGNQRSRFPNRFRILDEIMKMEGISQKKRSLEEFVDYAIYVMSRTGISLLTIVLANASGHQELKEIPPDNELLIFDDGPNEAPTEDDDSSQDDSQSETPIWYFPWLR